MCEKQEVSRLLQPVKIVGFYLSPEKKFQFLKPSSDYLRMGKALRSEELSVKS